MDKEVQDMKVVSFNNSQEELSDDIKSRLEIVDSLRKRVKDGEIIEFVGASLDTSGNAVIWTSIGDIAGGPEGEDFDFTGD
jgi:hypothetical protein